LRLASPHLLVSIETGNKTPLACKEIHSTVLLTSLQEDLPEAHRLLQQSHTDPTLFFKPQTPADLVALMDATGVSKICLSACYRPGKAVFSNEEVAKRSFPDRFVGIAGVDLLDPVGAVQEIVKYVKEEGFKGVRVVAWLRALPPTDRH
jgi:predicted TIM-barrel fold metal-dependent hydrolase